MGLMGLFGKTRLSEKKISKAAKLATNPFAQSDIRMREMQRLLDDDTPEAYRAVLKRFAANAQGHIADEDEKTWLEQALVERGEAVVEALRDFIANNEQLTYALRAFRSICGDPAASEFFLKVLQRYGPDDYRSVEAKLQLVWQLGESEYDDAVLAALIPFLEDHSDDVRWAVLDLLEKAADSDAVGADRRVEICAELGKMIVDDATGPRMQRRAIEVLEARQWQVPGEASDLAKQLDDTFFIDKKRFIRRRVKRA